MKTTDRIIAAAVTLFNEKGTKAVSTHHIAAAAGISPGNLYYHFRNKGEIIRAIFEEAERWGTAEFCRGDRGSAADGARAVAATWRLMYGLNRRYPFLLRELPRLVHGDPRLKERSRAFHGRLVASLDSMQRPPRQTDAVNPDQELPRRLLRDGSLFVALLWPAYLELCGERTNRENLARGLDLLHAFGRCPGASPGHEGEKGRKRGKKKG